MAHEGIETGNRPEKQRKEGSRGVMMRKKGEDGLCKLDGEIKRPKGGKWRRPKRWDGKWGVCRNREK